MHFVRSWPILSVKKVGSLARLWFPLLYYIKTKLTAANISMDDISFDKGEQRSSIESEIQKFVYLTHL